MPKDVADPKLAGAIGERLRDAMRRAGIATRAELEHRSGVQDRQLRRYLAGQHVPKVQALMSLSGVLDVSIDWLLLGRDEPPAAWFEWSCGLQLDERARELLRGLPTFGRRIDHAFYNRALQAWSEGRTREEVITAAHTPKAYKPPRLP